MSSVEGLDLHRRLAGGRERLVRRVQGGLVARGQLDGDRLAGQVLERLDVLGVAGRHEQALADLQVVDEVDLLGRSGVTFMPLMIRSHLLGLEGGDDAVEAGVVDLGVDPEPLADVVGDIDVGPLGRGPVLRVELLRRVADVDAPDELAGVLDGLGHDDRGRGWRGRLSRRRCHRRGDGRRPLSAQSMGRWTPSRSSCRRLPGTGRRRPGRRRDVV